jgi:hypothetical protein
VAGPGVAGVAAGTVPERLAAMRLIVTRHDIALAEHDGTVWNDMEVPFSQEDEDGRGTSS